MTILSCGRARHACFMLGAAFAVLGTCGSAAADAIDLTWFLLNVNPDYSVPRIAFTIFACMVINYALNLIVIGIPGMKWGAVPKRRVAFGLVWLTLLGQVADRIGAVLAVMFAIPADHLLRRLSGSTSSESWGGVLILLFLLFTGIAVGGLAGHFLRGRWKVSVRATWGIAIAAAIFTNPVWINQLQVWNIGADVHNRKMASGRPEWSRSDEWYHPTSLAAGWKELPQEDIYSVRPEKLDEAIRMLEPIAIKQLSEADASDWVGRPLKSEHGKLFYLIRALYMNKAGGEFSIEQKDRDLLVRHRGLRWGGDSMKRHALVINTADPPVKEYIK